MRYEVVFTKQAMKDFSRPKQAGLLEKAVALAKLLEEEPHTPPYEKLIGNLSGMCWRRINVQHRMVIRLMNRLEQ